MKDEDWEKLGWKQLVKELPFHGEGTGAYYISGHEWFGIGIWQDDDGWVKGFIGEWPYGDEGDMLDKRCCLEFLNQSVMWWKEIDDYPYYGIAGQDCPNMQKYLAKR